MQCLICGRPFLCGDTCGPPYFEEIYSQIFHSPLPPQLSNGPPLITVVYDLTIVIPGNFVDKLIQGEIMFQIDNTDDSILPCICLWYAIVYVLIISLPICLQICLLNLYS